MQASEWSAGFVLDLWSLLSVAAATRAGLDMVPGLATQDQQEWTELETESAELESWLESVPKRLRCCLRCLLVLMATGPLLSSGELVKGLLEDGQSDYPGDRICTLRLQLGCCVIDRHGTDNLALLRYFCPLRCEDNGQLYCKCYAVCYTHQGDLLFVMTGL